MRHFTLIAVFLPLIFSGIGAQTLHVDTTRDCPALGRFEYFADKSLGGKVFLRIIGCDGSARLVPFVGPHEPHGSVLPTGPISLPNDWEQRQAGAAGITEPGALLPISFTDAAGRLYQARNPVDDPEVWDLEGRYWNLTYLMHLEKGTPSPKPDYELLRKLTAIWQEYWVAQFPNGNLITDEDVHELGRVQRVIGTTLSGMLIRKMPSPSNGQRLTFEPIAPPFAGPVKVLASDGRIVWSGEVMGEMVIDLGNEPSGMYFLSSVGRSLVVNVVW